MRILYLHQYFNTPSDSAGTRSYEFAKRLVANGHQVHMVTSKRSRENVVERGWDTTNEDGIIVHWRMVPYNNKMSFAQRVKAFVDFALHASVKVTRLDYDVVFATSTPLTIAIPGLLAKYWRRKPLVFEVRDLWPELPIAVGAIKNKILQRFLYTFEQFVYKQSSQIIACSPGMKAGIENTGIDPHLITVIPNSCDNDVFYPSADLAQVFRAEHDWLGSRPLVVYTGAHGLINGVDYLVKLAVEVNKLDPSICFMTAGEGAEWQKVKQIAMKAGIYGKNFFMLGSVPKSEMPSILATATLATSLFIDLPAMWHNSANKFFDGLASGTPVAINYRGWQAELLGGHNAGLVLHHNDFELAGNQLVQYVRDFDQLEAAGKAAKHLALESFDRDKLSVLFEDVLQKACN